MQCLWSVVQLLARRSAANRGPPSVLAVRLLRQLLHWNPAVRPPAAAALRHAYFTVDLDAQRTYVCPGDMFNFDSSQHHAGWC